MNKILEDVINPPIGSIFEYPADWVVTDKRILPCDGRELKIVDYPELADSFEKYLGKKNYYGGDGITTFALPDMGEFRGLKGYIVAKEVEDQDADCD